MNENPIVRQIANVITTVGFLCLLAFFAHTHAISAQSLEYLLLMFTLGTSGVKLSKSLVAGLGRLLLDYATSSGLSQPRMAAVRPPPPPGPPNEPPNVHERTTTQVARQSQPGGDKRWKDPVPREERRGALLLNWSPSLLAGTLAAAAVVLMLLASSPVAIAGVLP